MYCNRIAHANRNEHRRGAIVMLAAAMLVVVFGFAAFTVDFGMITLTKAQLQSAADSSSHAAVLEVARSFGPGPEITVAAAETAARDRAVEMIGRFRTGDVVSTDADQTRDVRVGRRSWNQTTGSWDEEWGVSPYNMVEVTVRRTNADTTALPMTFAQILGREDFDLEATSVSALFPGTGFRLDPESESRIGVLPIALDLGSWNDLVDQAYNNVSHGYSDGYEWDESDGTVDDDSGDGIPEISMYPDLNSGLAPGNRGTVDLGAPGNSTSDIKRQITDGLNADDLSYFPDNKITFDEDGALYLNGDTGISAGIEDSLESIIGQVRCIPIFIEVTGQGNNTTYTIVKFVGVRIMDVKLSGGPNKRHLTVQPALFSCSHVIRANVPISVDSIMTQPIAVR